VGLSVISALSGLFWLERGSASGFGLGSLVFLFVGMIAVQALFDYLGGVRWMPGGVTSLGVLLFGWSRGVAVHALVLVGVGALGLASLRLTGGFVLGVVLASFLLALGRGVLLTWITGATASEIGHDGGEALTTSVSDPAFTGGILGFGRRARSLLPKAWLDSLPAPELAVESSRRRWQITTGLPGRAFTLILIWNGFGTIVGTKLFHFVERPPAVALLGHACWMTLWTFGSLLVLPALSRAAVFAADRAAAGSGLDCRGWINRFPDLVGEDGSANAAVQTVFYPVPSAEMRLRQLAQPSTGFVWGNLARNNLYYSWATLTLLGRAVHCNVGRPALWVFPPSA
jgi:hypothetical protein